MDVLGTLEELAAFKLANSGFDLVVEADTLTASRTVKFPDADATLVGDATTDTFTNKTFDVDDVGNTLSNVADANIKVGAAIDAAKIGNGDVDNTELSLLNGVTGTLATLAGTETFTNKTITALQITAGSTIDTDASGDLNIGTGANTNTLNLGRTGQTTVVQGDLQVDGTTTTVNSTTLDVTDANITINDGGNQAAADDTAGITVEMSDATDASILYDKDAASRWKVGDVGSEVEITDLSSTQTLTNKTLTSPTVNTPTVGGVTVYDESTAPAVSAANEGKIYFDDVADKFKVSENGGAYENLVGGGAGSGSGEINYILNPNAADDLTGWVDAGTGINITRTEVSAELPREWVTSTAIKLSNEGSGTNHLHYRFTMGTTDLNKKLKLRWDQIVGSAYTTGDYKVELWTWDDVGYTTGDTEVLLSSDVAGDSEIRATDGKFLATFDSDDRLYYELRFVRVDGGSTANDFIVIGNVIVGPGTAVTGAVVGEWKSFTPTFAGITVTGDMSYRRVGSNMEIVGNATVATTTAAEIILTIPEGLSVDDSVLSVTTANRSHFGTALVLDDGVGYFSGTVTRNTATTLGIVEDKGVSAGANWSTSPNRPHAWANPDIIEYHASVPIAEWAGAGTVNVGTVPSIVGAWTEYSGSFAGLNPLEESYFYKRIGGDMEIWANARVGVPTAATDILLSIPAGLTIRNDTLIGTPAMVNSLGGIAHASDTSTGANNLLAQPHRNSSTEIAFRKAHGSNAKWETNATPFAWASNDRINVRITVPIVEWQDGTQSDIIVGFAGATEDALGLVKLPGSMVRVDTGNGFGSTNTKIRRFTNVTETVGTDITYADSATLGGSFTINSDGIYSITYSDRHTSLAQLHGISLNSASLTSNVQAISASERPILTKNTAGDDTNVSVTLRLSATDVIRAHTNGTQNATDDRTQFVITQVYKF